MSPTPDPARTVATTGATPSSSVVGDLGSILLLRSLGGDGDPGRSAGSNSRPVEFDSSWFAHSDIYSMIRHGLRGEKGVR